jgi:hypothetical protein
VSRQRRAGTLYAVVAVVCAVAAIPLLDHLQDGPRTAVTFANDTVWDLRVELVLDDDRLLPVSTITAETTQSVEEIASPGDTWRFRWTFRGEELARTDLTDAQLRGADNRVAVPTEVAAALQAMGAPPAP